MQISVIHGLLSFCLLSPLAMAKGKTDIFQCDEDSDCIIVQDTWCRHSQSVNRIWFEEWQRQDQISTRESRASKLSCKMIDSSELEIGNFKAHCKRNYCQASRR